jgi:hypothetical protein
VRCDCSRHVGRPRTVADSHLALRLRPQSGSAQIRVKPAAVGDEAVPSRSRNELVGLRPGYCRRNRFPEAGAGISRLVCSDCVGGVAVETVAGMVVPAGGAGSLCRRSPARRAGSVGVQRAGDGPNGAGCAAKAAPMCRSRRRGPGGAPAPTGGLGGAAHRRR